MEGARRVFEEAGAQVEVHDVPGAFELPLAAKYCAESGRYAGVACLGAVIRGETDHYDFVCTEAARGIARVSLDTGVPCSFGVLTVDTMEQALARAGGGKRHQGEDAARAVLAWPRCGGSCSDVLINLYSDTQTRPTEAMRQAIASAEVARRAARAGPHDAAARGARGGAARPRGRGVPAQRHDVQPDRLSAARAARRRRDDPGPQRPPDHRRGGRAGAERAA